MAAKLRQEITFTSSEESNEDNDRNIRQRFLTR